MRSHSSPGSARHTPGPLRATACFNGCSEHRVRQLLPQIGTHETSACRSDRTSNSPSPTPALRAADEGAHSGTPRLNAGDVSGIEIGAGLAARHAVVVVHDDVVA